MGEWVDTPYGKRYREDYGSCEAFFMEEPDDRDKRDIPCDVTEIMLNNTQLNFYKTNLDKL